MEELKSQINALPNERVISSVAETFRVLGDPTRVSILFLLSLGESPVGKISQALNMTPSAISHQLRLLRSYHLVKRRRQGKEAYYSLEDRHVFNLLREFQDHTAHGIIVERIAGTGITTSH
ncbi:MAG: metalloregulator ArsR/SmtB family transcription factor [Thermodesulfobacteriota bacterium]